MCRIMVARILALCATSSRMAKKAKKCNRSRQRPRRSQPKSAKAREDGQPQGCEAVRGPEGRKTTRTRCSRRSKARPRARLAASSLDVAPAGAARVKRMIYPPGFRWSKAMKPIVGTDRCMHAHVGFLARGEIHIEYADGCVVEYKAPQVVAIDPGHDGWVVGKEPVILIEFDFEGDTVSRLGMPSRAPPLTAGQFARISVLPNVDAIVDAIDDEVRGVGARHLAACRTAAGVRRRGTSSSAARR